MWIVGHYDVIGGRRGNGLTGRNCLDALPMEMAAFVDRLVLADFGRLLKTTSDYA